jgi:hypothetical protein
MREDPERQGTKTQTAGYGESVAMSEGSDRVVVRAWHLTFGQ